MMAGVNIVHIPYRGSGPALTDLIGGQVQMYFDGIPTSIEHIRSGKLRALAVTSESRSEVLPDIPTLSDFLPGFEASFWAGVGVRTNTPSKIVDKLNKEINAGLNDSRIRVALLVQETLKRDPHSGHLFVFRGRRGGLIKVLWHDGQGMCLFAKRLERGRFIWPSPADGVVTITPAQLGYLLEGIDWRMPQQTWRPQAAG